MATKSEYGRYLDLRDLIRAAVEIAAECEGIENPNDITLAISPDLQTVFCTFTGRWEADFEPGQDWHIEHAESLDEVESIAEMYFDLRRG